MEDVGETEHGEDNVSHVSRVHRAGDGSKTVMRRSSVRCKEQYCKVWKMDICLAGHLFSIVDNLATEIGHGGSRDALALQT